MPHACTTSTISTNKGSGPNRLPEARTRGPLACFFYQFHNMLIDVLIAASAVTAMLGVIRG